MSYKHVFSLAVILSLAFPLSGATAADRATSPIQGAQTKAVISPFVIQRESTLSAWEIMVTRWEGLNSHLQCNWQRGQFVPATRDFRIMCGEVAAGRTLIVTIRDGSRADRCQDLRTPSVAKARPPC